MTPGLQPGALMESKRSSRTGMYLLRLLGEITHIQFWRAAEDMFDGLERKVSKSLLLYLREKCRA